MSKCPLAWQRLNSPPLRLPRARLLALLRARLASPGGEVGSLGAQPLPRVLQLVASKVSESTAFEPSVDSDHPYKNTVLIERIGSGTFGVVFLGVSDGVMVAVKVMPLHASTAKETYLEVGQLVKCKGSKYIIQLFDAFEVENKTYMWVVTELGCGSALDVMRRKGTPLTEQELLWIVAEGLRGLVYLHTEVKTIHRDFKAAYRP